MLDALSFTTRTVNVGGSWVLRVLCTDEDSGAPTAPTLTVTHTLPDGSTAAVTLDATTVSGVFRAYVPITVAGRHIATVSDGVDLVTFAAEAVDVVAAGGMPDVAAVDRYLGDHSWSDEDLQDTLDQEYAAQRGRCRIPAAYPADLRGALLRRVQRALAMRAISLGIIQSEDAGPSILPGEDPEVRRLEKPWRKRPIG